MRANGNFSDASLQRLHLVSINHVICNGVSRAGLLNYFKKGSSYKCQNFSRSRHSHKIMQMWHVLDFSNKRRNMRIWYDYTVYRYTKSGKWIQILTNPVSVTYCSAGGRRGFTIRLKRLKPGAPDFGWPQNFGSKDNFQRFCKRYICIFCFGSTHIFLLCR